MLTVQRYTFFLKYDPSQLYFFYCVCKDTKKSSKVRLSILSISRVHFVHFALAAKNIDGMGNFWVSVFRGFLRFGSNGIRKLQQNAICLSHGNSRNHWKSDYGRHTERTEITEKVTEQRWEIRFIFEFSKLFANYIRYLTWLREMPLHRGDLTSEVCPRYLTQTALNFHIQHIVASYSVYTR